MAGGFDIIVCRALASLADIIRLGRPLLKPGGRIIAMKGEISETELQAATPAGEDRPGTVHRIQTVAYTLPVLELPRRPFLVRIPGPAA